MQKCKKKKSNNKNQLYGQKTEFMTIPDASFLTCPVTYKTPRDNPIDLFGDSCFHVDNSGARATDWQEFSPYYLAPIWLAFPISLIQIAPWVI